MPRKDRSFRADDLLRIYCRHLTGIQKDIMEGYGLLYLCPGEVDLENIVKRILKSLTEPPLSELVEAVPWGGEVQKLLGYALDLYQIGERSQDLEEFVEITFQGFPQLPML